MRPATYSSHRSEARAREATDSKRYILELDHKPSPEQKQAHDNSYRMLHALKSQTVRHRRLGIIFDTEHALDMWSRGDGELADTRQTLLGMKATNKVVTVQEAIKAAETEKELGNE
jgi:hypothetical protein